MYNQKVEKEKETDVLILDNQWVNLVHEAKLKDQMLMEVKQHFAKVT